MYEQELDHEMSKTDDRPPGWAMREKIANLKAGIAALEGNRTSWAARLRQQYNDDLEHTRKQLLACSYRALQHASDAEADNAEDWADNWTVDGAGQLARKGGTK